MKRTVIIINADDFGMTQANTRAIIKSFDLGLVSDVSIIPNGAAFKDAVGWVLSQSVLREVGCGVHLNLTEGKPLCREMREQEKFCSNNSFRGLFKRQESNFIPLSKVDRNIIYSELDAQIQRCVRAGIKISHLDSHHHIHTRTSIVPIVFSLCKKYGIEMVRNYKTGRTSLPRRIVKMYLNKWIEKSQVVTTDYFGAADGFDRGWHGVWEIEVHPDYSDGNLIDRRDPRITDGVQIITLSDALKQIPKYNLVSWGEYKELTGRI